MAENANTNNLQHRLGYRTHAKRCDRHQPRTEPDHMQQVLPDDSTVGDHINSVVNSVGNSANTDNPVLEAQTGLNPVPVMSQVFSGTNFRAMYGGPGANYVFLGDAGNFAYGAVSVQLGVPLWTTQAVAGGHSLLFHPSSDWVGPYFMDPSATVQVPAGYNAQCKD